MAANPMFIFAAKNALNLFSSYALTPEPSAPLKSLYSFVIARQIGRSMLPLVLALALLILNFIYPKRFLSCVQSRAAEVEFPWEGL